MDRTHFRELLDEVARDPSRAQEVAGRMAHIYRPQTLYETAAMKLIIPHLHDTSFLPKGQRDLVWEAFRLKPTPPLFKMISWTIPRAIDTIVMYWWRLRVQFTTDEERNTAFAKIVFVASLGGDRDFLTRVVVKEWEEHELLLVRAYGHPDAWDVSDLLVKWCNKLPANQAKKLGDVLHMIRNIKDPQRRIDMIEKMPPAIVAHWVLNGSIVQTEWWAVFRQCLKSRYDASAWMQILEPKRPDMTISKRTLAFETYRILTDVDERIERLYTDKIENRQQQVDAPAHKRAKGVRRLSKGEWTSMWVEIGGVGRAVGRMALMLDLILPDVKAYSKWRVVRKTINLPDGGATLLINRETELTEARAVATAWDRGQYAFNSNFSHFIDHKVIPSMSSDFDRILENFSELLTQAVAYYYSLSSHQMDTMVRGNQLILDGMGN